MTPEQQIAQQLKVLLVEKLDLNLKLDEICERASLKRELNINSLAIVQLLVFIEQDFDIEWAVEDLIPENFQNLQTVANLIVQKGTFII